MMMLDLFKAKASTGGKYISFEKSRYQRRRPSLSSSSKKKRTWRTCGSWNNVQRVMESLDETTSETGMEISSSSNNTAPTDDGTMLEHSGRTPSCTSCPMSSASSSVADDVVRTSRQPYQQEQLTFSSANDISCNYTLLNHTRRRWNSKLRPLRRCDELDAMAEKHARAMADSNSLFHYNPTDLITGLEIEPKRRLGENVISGSDPLDMHMKMLEIMTNYTNMVDCRYDNVGIATARSRGGRFYLCILFRG